MYIFVCPLNIDKVFDIEVKVEQGEGETTIAVNENEFAFAYANNTQPLISPVEIQNSKIMAKKVGRTSLKVSVPESANYLGAEKEFVLEVRPQKVEFNQQNLSDKSITKKCGESVDVNLMIDDKPLAQALQNSGSSDDILVFEEKIICSDFLRRRRTDDCYHRSKRLSIDSDLSQMRR